MPRPIDALVLDALADAWDQLNYERFGRALRAPTIGFLDGGSARLGEWRRSTREIRVARAVVFDGTWLGAIEVLAHEMAHQYVSEVLRVDDETAHGAAFRKVCAERGIDGTAAGAIELPSEADRILRKIRGLLALADSPNRNEAELAAEAARRMMLKHNLAALHDARTYVVRQAGPVHPRLGTAERILGGILARHFFVRTLLVPGFDVRSGKSGKALEVSGTPENVELALWVHDVVLGTAQRAWEAHRKLHRTSPGEQARFRIGVMDGFRETLERGTAKSEAEGLVWVGDAKLDDHHHARHPRIVTTRATFRADGGYASGKDAGRKIVLRKPVHGTGGGLIG